MASDIIQRLEAYPNKEFLSGSHGEAMRWLMDFGIADDLPADSVTKPFIGVSDACRTHWIVVRVVRGEPEPGADGLYVSCIPRSAIDGEELKTKIHALYGGKVLKNRAPE